MNYLIERCLIMVICLPKYSFILKEIKFGNKSQTLLHDKKSLKKNEWYEMWSLQRFPEKRLFSNIVFYISLHFIQFIDNLGPIFHTIILFQIRCTAANKLKKRQQLKRDFSRFLWVGHLFTLKVLRIDVTVCDSNLVKCIKCIQNVYHDENPLIFWR